MSDASEPRLNWAYCDDPASGPADFLVEHYWNEEGRSLCGRLCMPCKDRHENPNAPCRDCRRVLKASTKGEKAA